MEIELQTNRGLLAELKFLDNLLNAYPSEMEIILQAWYGQNVYNMISYSKILLLK